MVANTSLLHPVDTLAIDIGGTGLKASVLDASGQMEHARVRTATPYPLSPQKLILELQDLIAQLPPFDRVSVGFPGMVRDGRILSAPHFISPDGPGGTPAPKLERAWHRFDLAASLEHVTGKPTKVANDADLQGAAVVEGKGFEAVVTLGTGVGTAFFKEGILLPHFEFAHHPLRKGATYNEVLGEAARKRAGNKKWKARVLEMVETLRALTFFDHCYIGGGNSARLGAELPEGVSVVDNSAGILGGIKLWEVTAAHPAEGAAPAAAPDVPVTDTDGPVTAPSSPSTAATAPRTRARRAPATKVSSDATAKASSDAAAQAPAPTVAKRATKARAPRIPPG